jgi:hypothetical protein
MNLKFKMKRKSKTKKPVKSPTLPRNIQPPHLVADRYAFIDDVFDPSVITVPVLERSPSPPPKPTRLSLWKQRLLWWKQSTPAVFTTEAPLLPIEYDASQFIKVCIATWNMNGSTGKEQLAALYNVEDYVEGCVPWNERYPHDMVVIGTQECMTSIPMSMLFPDKSDWESRLQSHMGPTYTMVKSDCLAALHLAVFVHTRLGDDVHDIESIGVKTGFNGYVGNKGAVAVTLSIRGKRLLFVNSHLTAHQDATMSRNDDIQKIMAQLGSSTLSRKPVRKNTVHSTEVKDAPLKRASTTPTALAEPTTDIHRAFDYLFWLGDLNYRVQMDRKRANLHIRKGQHLSLLKHDQLRREVHHGRVFTGWREAEITFPPTFKFDLPGTVSTIKKRWSHVHPSGFHGVYDSSTKQRVPSWTDRILYTSPHHSTADWHKRPIVPTSYRAVMDLVESDHRPVTGEFLVNLY